MQALIDLGYLYHPLAEKKLKLFKMMLLLLFFLLYSFDSMPSMGRSHSTSDI